MTVTEQHPIFEHGPYTPDLVETFTNLNEADSLEMAFNAIDDRVKELGKDFGEFTAILRWQHCEATLTACDEDYWEADLEDRNDCTQRVMLDGGWAIQNRLRVKSK